MNSITLNIADKNNPGSRSDVIINSAINNSSIILLGIIIIISSLLGIITILG